MIEIKEYDATSDYASAAAKVKEFFEDISLFDEVTIEDIVVTSQKLVSCYNAGSRVATFAFSSKKLEVGFRNYSFNTGDTENKKPITFVIAKCDNGILIDYYMSWTGAYVYKVPTICICKTFSNVPMLIWHMPLNTASGGSYICMDSSYTTTPTDITDTLSDNNNYSRLVGICTTNTDAETIATAKKVYMYHVRQTTIPITIVSIVNINGTNYLTDGMVAISDT